MAEKSLDESYTASLSSRRQSSTRDRWTSGYQFLIFSLSCTLSEDSLVQFVFEEDSESHGNFFQHFVGYIIIGLPIYYMQVFIGQYTQIGIISLRFICPIGHGLCYLYIVNLMASCILNSLSFVNYVVYQFTTLQKNMPWTVCPDDHQAECWTNDERNERCPANCLKVDAKLSSHVYYERKFLTYKQDIFFLHRGMLPLSIGWILIVCLTVYAVTNQRKLLKILLVLSLSSVYLVLVASIIENGFSYVFTRSHNVNFRTLLSYQSWKHVILTSINRLSLGRGFHILNGSFLSSTTQSGTLSTAAVLLDFLLSIFLSTLALQCLGIIETTAKTDAQHKYPFRYDKSDQIYGNIPQAMGCMGLSHFFTVVYFFGCLILLVNHEICHLITIEKCLSDLFPSLSRYRKYVYSITCLFCFLFSVILISTSRLIRTMRRHMTEGLMNAISFNTMMTTLTVFWIYGVQNLCNDVHFLIGAQPNKYWRTCWYFMPILTTFAFAVSMQSTDPSMYWIFALYVSPFVFTGVYEIFKYVRARNIMGLFEKEAQFGPPNETDKIHRKFFSPKTEIRSRRQNETCAHHCLAGSKVLQKLAQEEEQRERE